MAAFRILNQNPVYFDNDGVPCANGFLYFYTTGTSTPLTTYSDAALTTPNANPVELDANGRAESNIFGDGEYRVVLKDADAATIWTRDNVTGGASGAGQEIPDGEADQVLSTDGANLVFIDIRQVPDPTGSSGKILSTDGESLLWIDAPADGADGAAGSSDVADTSTSLKVGNMRISAGSGTGVNIGGRTQTVSVTFAVAFTSTPVFAYAIPTNSSLSSYGNMPTVAVTALSTTGATFKFTMSELDDGRSVFDYNAAVTFLYMVMGVDAA